MTAKSSRAFSLPCRGKLLRCGALACVLLAASASFSEASADDYPSRPIRIIAPIAAGGPSDTAARLAAVALGRQLNQSVVVENRTGAGGVVGTEMAAAAPPDGYTLLLSIAATFTVIPAAKKVNYDVGRDFIALGQIWSAPQALVVPTPNSSPSPTSSLSPKRTPARSLSAQLESGRRRICRSSFCSRMRTSALFTFPIGARASPWPMSSAGTSTRCSVMCPISIRLSRPVS